MLIKADPFTGLSRCLAQHHDGYRLLQCTRDYGHDGEHRHGSLYGIHEWDAVPALAEHCICAAVLLPDGRKVSGHRHWDAMQTARALGFTELVTQEMQGFITTTGRFVTRAEGLALQEAAGIQSARGHYNGRALFSEDLY